MVAMAVQGRQGQLPGNFIFLNESTVSAPFDSASGRTRVTQHGVPLDQGQIDTHRRALSGLALHFHCSTALTNDSIHQREPQTGMSLFGREERLEHLGLNVQIHPAAAITDGNAGHPLRGFFSSCSAGNNSPVTTSSEISTRPLLGMASRAFATRCNNRHSNRS